MKIAHLTISGVRSLPDLDCDFVSPSTGRPHDSIVVTGPAASGKTSLLELMLAVLETVAPYQGIVRASDWMADAKRGARVDVDLWLDGEGRDGGTDDEPAPSGVTHAVVRFTGGGVARDVDRKVARALSRYDHDPARGKREYFPENRGRAWAARNDGLGAHEQALLRSSRDPQKYSFVPRFLAELRTQPAWAKTFARHLEILSPALRYAPAARTGDPTACFANERRSGLCYDALGSSDADAVIVAATAALIGLSHSIVFLDRPELYVASERLVAWVSALAKIGEDNQWIIATGDRALAASVPRGALVSLGRGDARDGARAERPSAAPSSTRESSWRPA